jgi:DNA-binding protein H-NS
MKNPEAMSFDELLTFRERLVGMIARMVKGARRDLQAQMAQLDGLMSGERRKSGRPPGRPHALLGRKVPPKYRGPNGETWAGRGMMPVWLRDEMKRGRKLEHFAIGKRGRAAKAAGKRAKRKKRARP